MSSDPMKMASRYIHLDCTFIHTSITSEIVDISFSHLRGVVRARWGLHGGTHNNRAAATAATARTCA